MSLKLLERSLLPLFVATLIIGVFFWNFTDTYTFIIQKFTDNKLSDLYIHLFIFTFLIFTLFISLTNIINHYILQSKVFVTVTVLSLLLFYSLSYPIIVQQITYFINYPFSPDSLMGIILFVVGTVSYALYSVALLLFNRFIPLGHTLIFTGLSLLYSTWFIDNFCYPISKIFENFQ